MITERYVGFSTAKLLKEAGFDEECQSFYEESNMQVWGIKGQPSMMATGWLPRPTQSLAARWLREVHRVYIMISPISDGFEYRLYDLLRNKVGICFGYTKAKLYEDALERGLHDCLKQIIKNKEFYESIEYKGDEQRND